MKATWTTKTGETYELENMQLNHLLNVKKMLERTLDEDPGEQAYMGFSDFGEDAVEQENRHNRQVREKVIKKLAQVNKELERRESIKCNAQESDTHSKEK